MSLYDRDLHAWAHEQATLARDRSSNALDWDNVAEELADLGKQQQAELESRYRVLVMHLLKWAYQPERRTGGREATIKVQRSSIERHLRKNPSLRSADNGAFADAYDEARLAASNETGLAFDDFRAKPPVTRAQARDTAFWPGADVNEETR